MGRIDPLSRHYVAWQLTFLDTPRIAAGDMPADATLALVTSDDRRR
jgi:hypothetical protein